jgi:hypothetical protein
MTSFNIVDLITNNPITKLTETHNNILLNKVKSTFNESEQQLFIASFYSYLNYHKTDDYIVDLDNIWQWLGFTNKANAKKLLLKYFLQNKDYKILLDASIKQKIIKINTNMSASQLGETVSKVKNKGSGGQNIQKFYLNIKTFKSLCLKTGTKKADEIHEYYIKLEELIQEVLEEEATEMKNKLLVKDNELNEKDNLLKNANQDKYKTIEKTLVSQFPVNNECIYFGTIDNTNEKGEKLIKFGHSNNLPLRVQNHHKTYDNFILRDVFKVHNRQEIENAIKAYSKIKSHLRTIEVNGNNKHEILAYDTTYFTINRLSKYIKDIISEKTYNIENFNKLVEENSNYKAENERLIVELESAKMEIQNNKETIEKLNKSLKVFHENELNNETNNENIVNNDSIIEFNNEHKTKFDKFVSECCIVRNDVEVDSTTIIAQFRIWNREKPKKILFYEFNKYLRTKFLATRLHNQCKNQYVHGFKGIMLKAIDYNKKFSDNITENFLFEDCVFSPNNRTSNALLLEGYINYKKNNSLTINNDEYKELRNYLRECQYVVGGPIRLHNDNNTYEGFYGLSLKNDINNNEKYKRIATSIGGKKVQKIDINTKTILNSWESIVKAAVHEEISASKLSRALKNKTVYDDYRYEVC